MLLMNQPLICPICGVEMNDYWEKPGTSKFNFKCPNNHILEVTEDEYLKRIRSQSRK